MYLEIRSYFSKIINWNNKIVINNIIDFITSWNNLWKIKTYFQMHLVRNHSLRRYLKNKVYSHVFDALPVLKYFRQGCPRIVPGLASFSPRSLLCVMSFALYNCPLLWASLVSAILEYDILLREVYMQISICACDASVENWLYFWMTFWQHPY